MAVKMSKAKAEEFVFDGDSDSDDDIEGFNQQAKKIDPNAKDKTGDSGSDEEEEEDDEEDKMEEDTDSSEASEDEEAKEKTLKAHVEKQSQISKLHEQLSKLEHEEQSDESESSENEDSEEDADEDLDAEDDSDEDSNADDKPSITNNEKKVHAKKRKVDGDFENDVKKVKNDSAVEKIDERQKFKNKLSKLSIHEIQKMKEKIGLKLFNQSLGVSKPAFRSKEEFKRANKNRPREMSSKKEVPRFREIIPVAKAEDKRDPRFDPLCGEFDEKIFRDSYKFVSDIKNDELTKLKKQLAEEEDPERKEKIKFLITRMKNQQRQEKKNEEKIEDKKIETKKTKELLMAGKKPFIMGKAKQKEFDLAAKYEKLKESGGLDNYIKKKTKKNATKDRKKLEKLQ